MGKHSETEGAKGGVCSGNGDSALGWAELGWVPWCLSSAPCWPACPYPQLFLLSCPAPPSSHIALRGFGTLKKR